VEKNFIGVFSLKKGDSRKGGKDHTSLKNGYTPEPKKKKSHPGGGGTKKKKRRKRTLAFRGPSRGFLEEGGEKKKKMEGGPLLKKERMYFSQKKEQQILEGVGRGARRVLCRSPQRKVNGNKRKATPGRGEGKPYALQEGSGKES